MAWHGYFDDTKQITVYTMNSFAKYANASRPLLRGETHERGKEAMSFEDLVNSCTDKESRA